MMMFEINQDVIDDMAAEFKKSNADMTGFGFLIGSEEAEITLLEGVIIPEQERQFGSARVVPDAQAEAYRRILEMGKRIIGIVAYIPSSQAMYFSETFKKAYDVLPFEKKLGLVLNEKGDYKKIE